MSRLRQGIDELARLEATRLVAVSSAYETEPRLVDDQPPFLNAVAKIETRLSPRKLLACMQAIERRAGRRPPEERQPAGPRRLDLDLLLYGDRRVDEAGLAIPHPGLPDRRFVLVPMCEVDGGVRHPPSGRTVRELLEACEDEGRVERLGDIRE